MNQRDYRTHIKKGLLRYQGSLVFDFFTNTYASISHSHIMAHETEKEELNAVAMSLGNITLGGTGKTPHVEFFAEYFAGKDFKVGVATGGYRGSRRDQGVLVSDGRKIIADYIKAGDEAVSIASSLTRLDIPVYVHRNRIDAGKELITRFNCNFLLLDDAYHFVSIKKDFDILLINSLNPFGKGVELKPGVLREPLTSISRANAVILTDADLVAEKYIQKLYDKVREYNSYAPIFRSRYLPNAIRTNDGRKLPFEQMRLYKLIPLSGLGNPEGFEKSLEGMGMQYLQPLRFNDHHPYSEKDLVIINKAIEEDIADGIITTPKDFIRLENLVSRINGRVFVLESKIDIENSCLEWMDQILEDLN